MALRGRHRPVVGVNLTWLVPGVVGGSEEYTLGLLRAYDDLQATGPRLRLYSRPDLLKTHDDLAQRFECVTAPTLRSIPPAAARAARVGLEQTWLARASAADDMVHHAGGVVPFVRSRPSLVTVLDLQPIDQSHHFSVVKRRWLGSMIPYSVRVARLVVCPSRFTADRIADRWSIPPSMLAVVPHGIEPDGADVDVDDVGDGHQSSPDSGLPDGALPHGQFVLYPAITYPHKRHLDAVAALARLAHRDPDCIVDLVFTGRPGPLDRAVRDEASRLGVDGRVHLLGRVPEDVLRSLYRRAAAVVFPSSYEGFGLPCLEAMSHAVPVIASRAGSLPEVVGDAALTVELGDVEALSSALSRVLNDRALRRRLIDRGHQRIVDFSSDTAARALLDAYRRALAAPGEVDPGGPMSDTTYRRPRPEPSSV